MKALFIGGIKDGERIEIGDIRPHMDFAVLPPGDPPRSIVISPSLVTFRTESYHVESITTRRTSAMEARFGMGCDEDRAFYFYVLDGLDLNDAIEMLIGGYLVTKTPALVANQTKATTWTPRGQGNTDRVP